MQLSQLHTTRFAARAQAPAPSTPKPVLLQRTQQSSCARLQRHVLVAAAAAVEGAAAPAARDARSEGQRERDRASRRVVISTSGSPDSDRGALGKLLRLLRESPAGGYVLLDKAALCGRTTRLLATATLIIKQEQPGKTVQVTLRKNQSPRSSNKPVDLSAAAQDAEADTKGRNGAAPGSQSGAYFPSMVVAARITDAAPADAPVVATVTLAQEAPFEKVAATVVKTLVEAGGQLGSAYTLVQQDPAAAAMALRAAYIARAKAGDSKLGADLLLEIMPLRLESDETRDGRGLTYTLRVAPKTFIKAPRAITAPEPAHA